ncbi:hypothetical protein, partial [Methylobacterium oryzisoli]|uniref:hypothetical protein n=1 Tax=Methylobacterium oryzisoli TaxID=3385502 RepID=UPI00397C1F10
RLVDEPIVHQHVDRLAAIQDGIEQRCPGLEARPDALRASTLFRCWPPASPTEPIDRKRPETSGLVEEVDAAVVEVVAGADDLQLAGL